MCWVWSFQVLEVIFSAVFHVFQLVFEQPSCLATVTTTKHALPHALPTDWALLRTRTTQADKHGSLGKPNGEAKVREDLDVFFTEAFGPTKKNDVFLVRL